MKTNPINTTNTHRLECLSNFLKEYRINSGITQDELSHLSNLHRNTIIRAENCRNITILSLMELADALDVDLVELFYDIK